VCGVSIRRVDQLVESLGLRISKSEVSRIAGLLDEQVEAFRQRWLEGRYPYLFVDAMLEEAEDDVLAFYAFPAEHWSKLRSTDPLERFNGEIGRRTDVVGIFPDDASLVRLVSMLAIEANDAWLVGRAYISQKSMAEVLSATTDRAPTMTDIDQQETPELAAA
jgi:transposase-like protein